MISMYYQFFYSQKQLDIHVYEGCSYLDSRCITFNCEGFGEAKNYEERVGSHYLFHLRENLLGVLVSNEGSLFSEIYERCR